MDHNIQIQKAAAGIFTETGYVEIDSLKYHPEIRAICEGNSCRSYGTCWACPPGVGTLEECEERVRQYDHFLLLSKKYTLKNSFDLEGMRFGMMDFKEAVDVFEEEIRGILPNYRLLSNEGCGRCKKCTYPEAPCRFPDKLHGSLEGYGFIVTELAKAANMRYNNGPNSVTFFGALLY